MVTKKITKQTVYKVSSDDLTSYQAANLALSTLRKEMYRIEQERDRLAALIQAGATIKGLDKDHPVKMHGHIVSLVEEAGRVSWKDVAFEFNPNEAAIRAANPPKKLKMVIQ
jgi:hypothetical protein